MKLPHLFALFVLGCGTVEADPTPDESMLERKHPGYCTASSDVDGRPGSDSIRTAFYENDLLVRDEFDSDLDGDTDVVGTFFYDSNERIERWENDEFADGVIDEVRTYEWSADRMLFERWDTDVDTVVDMEIAFTHDDEGRRLRGEGNVDDQGQSALVIGFEYDESGNNTRIWMDGLRGLPDQRLDRTIDHAYDKPGNLVATWIDVDADGVGDIVVSYDYDCWSAQ